MKKYFADDIFIKVRTLDKQADIMIKTLGDSKIVSSAYFLKLETEKVL